MTDTTLNEAWKELIATALRRNVVVAVGEHRAAVEAAAVSAREGELRAAGPCHGSILALPIHSPPRTCHRSAADRRMRKWPPCSEAAGPRRMTSPR